MKNLKIYTYKLTDKFSHRIPKGILLTSLLLLIALLTPPSVTAAPEPAKAVAENVFLLVIDGIRNDEAFDDSTHQYIPHIWNDLKPLGTINTNFWNTGITMTTAGHTQLVTGVRSRLQNETPDSSKLHSEYPNIFEYYRKQKNISENKVWFIAGKGVITNSVNYSLHPDYANLGASKDSISMSDPGTWASVQQKMDTYHPSLMVINLKQVDSVAHKGVYTDYSNAIKVADQIVYDLWQKIQKDPYYKDKTDLIVTTDHGRHSDGYSTGFKDHGGRNHGNRHLLFLAIGPDFKQNEVINIRRDQIDIVPTIGAILEVQTPYADGEVMTELFNNSNLALNNTTGGQRRVSISACSSGVHMVWSQKNGQEWDIYYKKSQDRGNTWTEPIKLFENGKDNNYFYEAKITSQDNGLVYVTAVGYSLIDEGGPTYGWKIFGRKSLDGGNNWEAIQELKNITDNFVAYPGITSSGNNILITYSLAALRGLYSVDKGKNFIDYLITDLAARQTPIFSTTTNDQNRFYVVWTNERASSTYKYWNVFFNRSYANPMSWETDKAITANTVATGDKTFFMANSIAVNNSGLIKILSTIRQDTEVSGKITAGKWKTRIKSSSDFGNTFSDWVSDFYDSANYEAWNPKVSFIKPETSNFVVLWEQHRNNTNGEIYGRKKIAGAWQEIFLISSIDNKDSANPDLVIYNGNAYIGWQDYEIGNWQIKVQIINIASPTISITSPENGTTVSGTINVSASTFNNVGVTSVQFKLDGNNLGAEDTTPPYSISWDTTTTSNGSHSLIAVARNAAGNITTSSPITITVNNIPLDTISPSAIVNLSISNLSQTSVSLNWTSPGDDGNIGTASSYDIRYLASRITKTNWDLAIQVIGEPIPKTTGTSQSMTITGLSPNTTYYFAIKTKDKANNISGLSNIVSATTQFYSLFVSLSAQPNSGYASLSIDLTATVSGIAVGSINYTFYCNRSDTGTNITSGWCQKRDSIAQDLYTAIDCCNYSSVGTYTAKVIIERGTLLAEVRTTIQVNPPIEMTIEELQAKIAELLVKIAQLQAQIAALQSLPKDYIFKVNLRYGDRSEDVRYLQIFLKTIPDVYPEGLVTSYFGLLTEKAVIRLQEKYANEILAPLGLAKGTGFVGLTTRAKINEILGK